MPADPKPLTVAQVVHRAVDVCDPSGGDAALGEVFARFEDDDRPVRGVEDLGEQVAEAVRRIEPEGDDGALEMVWAVATYLSFRRDEAGEDREELLRLAARAEWKGKPPDVVVEWLAGEGVLL